MKKLLFGLLLVISLPVFSQATGSDCGKFRTGRLAYRDSSGTICEIKRTGSTQTDYNPATKLTIKSKIEWISDCSYKLTQRWASSKDRRKSNGSSVTYRITNVTDNMYSFSCTCSDQSTISGTVVKRE